MAPTDKTVGAIPAKMARHHRGDGGAPSGNTQEAAGTRQAHQTLGLPQARGAMDDLALTQMLTASIKTMPMPVTTRLQQ
jgi:hypothetical protein